MRNSFKGKSHKTNHKFLLIAYLALSAGSMNGQLFVVNLGNGTIGEYALSGAPINTALVSGLNYPGGLALAGNDLFTGNSPPGYPVEIGEYTTSGTTVNSALIPGFLATTGLAVNGNDLFVEDYGNGTVGEYTLSGATVNSTIIDLGTDGSIGLTIAGNDMFVANVGNGGLVNGAGVGTIGEYTLSGATVNASLISGLSGPWGMAVAGNDLFVANWDTGTIGEYTLSGATVNAALISGLNHPGNLVLVGNDLFVVNNGGNTIGEYTTSGATVNAALVSGLDEPIGLVIESAPEPSTLDFCSLGAGLLFCYLTLNHKKLGFKFCCQ